VNRLPISVIVLAKNAMNTLAECLASVACNSPREIIVVDGNSADNTWDIARRFTFRVYSDEGKGISYARQLGAEKATEEYVAYVDSNVVLTEGALATMLACLQGSDCVWVNARIAPDMKCSGYWEWARYQHELLSLRRGNHKNFVSTRAGLVGRETILNYRFDISESHLDDTDLEIRLKKDGHRFCTASAFYDIRSSPDLKSLAKHGFLYGLVSIRYMRRYGPWHVRFWPPLADLYWLSYCLTQGKFKMIPYFTLEAVMQTLGMVTSALRPNLKSLRDEGE
jgi:glycosyltransferase involved in cell wall biosynthesis